MPTPTLSAADFVKFTAQRPQTRLPPRTSASSSGNEAGNPKDPDGVRKAQGFLFLTQTKQKEEILSDSWVNLESP